MKEFEKWTSENCNIKGCPHEASCNGCENIWRAALEWALEQETWIGPDDGGGWGVDKWKIEEELRE